MAEYIELALMVIGVASFVVNLTPNDTDNKVIVKINKVLGALAVNFNVKGIFNR
jgi:hypothetical protein